MAGPRKPFPVQTASLIADGVEESASPFLTKDDQDRLTREALEEYRRTGESISLDEAMAELDRLIAERRTRKI